MTWRPTQWQTQAPQKVIITFPGQGQSAQYASAVGSNVTLPATQTLYAFDAEIMIEHQQELTRTKHPVQTGASISDHAYIEPAVLVLDVGMSDGMDAYFNPSTWTGSQSQSISAYQTMLALQYSRIPLSITTRLRTYQNMVIDSLNPTDTAKTAQGLRMRVVFGQIFLANISQPNVSARPQDTNSTNLGTVNPQPPTDAQVSQNMVPGGVVTSSLGGQEVSSTTYNSQGAGDWSSTNTNELSSLPPPK